jgi:DUF971 family protein
MNPWPSQVKLKRAERVLEVSFEDGSQFQLPAEYLRVESPSAEVQGHSGQKTIIGGKANVGITGIEPVGRYAVRILFDDTHSTGIFSWAYLHELGRDYEQRWGAYLKALAARGLKRAPR